MILSKDTFTKGDWIVHAYYGLGQVTGEDKKSIDGEQQIYIKVKTLNSLYWVPITDIDSDRIRPLVSKDDIKRALTLLKNPPEELPLDFKERGKLVSGALKDISLLAKVRMIRDLSGRRASFKLNLSEAENLKQMRELFLNEWTMVMTEDREILEKRLNEALKTSITKG